MTRTINEREQDLEQCLSKIFEYCTEHKDTCTGCIFWREISVGNRKAGHCRVMYAPDVFGESACISIEES